MKKLFTYLAFLGAAAFMAFSCSPLPEDKSHTDVVVAAPDVIIAITDVTDYTATVSIAPAGDANYYAYVVDKSDEPEELDPEKLYANKYSSVKSGLVKYQAQPSTEFSLEGLAPNTVYQVYAVAGSTTGVVGTIAIDSFKTTDKGTPTPVSPTKKDNVITLAFSEAVNYVSSKPATAIYYAYNNAVIGEDPETGKKIVVDSGEVGEAHVAVSVSGKDAKFTVTLDGTNPLPDGAYFTVAYPAGAFEDVVGNPAPAMKHVTGVTSDGKLGFGNLYNRIPTKAFALDFDEEKETAAPSEYSFLYGIPEGTEFYDLVKNATATMTVICSSDSKVITTVYNLENDYDWEYDDEENAIVVYYPDDVDITGGDIFKINIDEGAIQDIYGNTNNAFEVGYLYSYGYKLSDFYGTYTYTGQWYDHGPFTTEGVVIAPREPFEDPDQEEYYKDRNVAIYGLFKNNPSAETLPAFESYNTTHYGTFNVDTGILDVEWEYEGEGAYPYYEWEDYVIIFSTDYANYTFFQEEEGKLVQNEDLRVYLNGLGTWGWYDAGSTLEKTSDDYDIPDEEVEAQASRLSPKSPAKKNVNVVHKDFIAK